MTTRIWFFRTRNHYTTRGAEVRFEQGGWWLIVGRKVRGPFRCVDTAMDAIA
jgi:hypothetical protein